MLRQSMHLNPTHLLSFVEAYPRPKTSLLIFYDILYNNFEQSSCVQVMAMTCREVLLCNPEGSRIRLIPLLSLDIEKADIPEQVPTLINDNLDL